jgi:hypothetical protein
MTQDPSNSAPDDLNSGGASVSPDSVIPRTTERDARLKAAQQHDAELREAQYTRKLTLAILSTLQHKGILSSTEVEQLLIAAKRATDASFAPSVAVRSEFEKAEVQGDKSKVRREAKPPPVFDIQID